MNPLRGRARGRLPAHGLRRQKCVGIPDLPPQGKDDVRDPCGDRDVEGAPHEEERHSHRRLLQQHSMLEHDAIALAESSPRKAFVEKAPTLTW